MRCAFICWRPFQIFNAINFIIHDCEGSLDNSDLYILNLESNIRYLDEINKTKLFRKVIIFEKHAWKNSFITRFHLFMDYFFPLNAIKRDLKCEYTDVTNNYDRLISSGFLPFFIHMTQVNRKAEIVFLEDGIISYQGDERLLRDDTVYSKLLFRVFHKGDRCVNISRLYLNNIQFSASYYPYPIVDMPKLDDTTIEILKNVFRCHSYERYTKKIIFLNQPLSAEKIVDDLIINKTIDVLKLISDKIMIREHPNNKNIIGCFDQEKDNALWEIRAKEIDDSMVLIGFFSTALLTPYLLYDCCPHLIFLYRIILDHNSVRYNSIDALITRLFDTYGGELEIPNNLEELKIIVQRLKEK